MSYDKAQATREFSPLERRLRSKYSPVAPVRPRPSGHHQPAT